MFSDALPVLKVVFFVACAIWSGAIFWYLDVYQVDNALRRGRKAIELYLQRRGQQPISIEQRSFALQPLTAGQLSPSAVLFEVVARTAQGPAQTYHWAYDPSGRYGENAGLKQLSNGRWHDAPLA